jgi:inosine/xanthosine triphosphate pyrophosphatase family protein
MKFKIISSNQNKINEYLRFGIHDLEVISGKDIREVAGTSEEVVIYKAIEAGENVIVEDAILIIDNVEIVDIKYQLENLSNYIGKHAVFKVSLGFQSNGQIKTYTSELLGTIQNLKKKPDSFGFDYCFIPKHSTKSLYELDKLGLKDNFSPRRNAIVKLINDEFDNLYNVSEIKTWNGEFQI